MGMVGRFNIMTELKYTYALDKNEKCVGIENAQKGIEYRCPHCKGEMVVKEVSIKVSGLIYFFLILKIDLSLFLLRF